MPGMEKPFKQWYEWSVGLPSSRAAILRSIELQGEREVTNKCRKEGFNERTHSSGTGSGGQCQGTLYNHRT